MLKLGRFPPSCACLAALTLICVLMDVVSIRCTTFGDILTEQLMAVRECAMLACLFVRTRGRRDEVAITMYWPYRFSVRSSMRTHHTCLSCPFSTPLCQLRRRLPTSILRLPKTKRHIPILNHMLYLPPHYHTLSATTPSHPLQQNPRLTRQRKQYQPIHHQHGPKHRQIKHLKPTRQKPNHHRPRRTMPELKLRQPSYKRSELFILLRRQAGLPVFQAFIGGAVEGGVEFGL